MRRIKFWVALITTAVLLGMIVFAFQQSGGQLEVFWGKQWGTTAIEGALDLALDGKGNIYIAGWTEGSLFGQNQGKTDIFIVKLDSNGQVLWSKQLGTVGDEGSIRIALDGEGNVYLVTETDRDWFGQGFGREDIVVLKLSAAGQLLWGKRFGTNDQDFFTDIAVDQQGYVYIVGLTMGSLFAQYQRGELGEQEGFLAKFDASGNLVWGKQFKDDVPEPIAVNNQGNIYISGSAYDEVNNTIVGFVAKLSTDGTVIWRKTEPTDANEGINSLIVDGSGNVYGAGEFVVFLDENVLFGVPDAFVVKYSGVDGSRIWSKRFKSKGEGEIDEEFLDVRIDGQGYIYVVGEAKGSLFGDHLGDADVVFAKFDGQGNMIWGKQWGSDKGERGTAIAVDGQGNIYVVGGTNGNLFGTNAGEADVFVVKFRQ